MVRKKIIYMFCLFLVALFIYLNYASAAVVVVSPANFTNQSGRITINISYVNTSTDITGPTSVNTTFYYNNTAIPIQNFACLAGSCNASFNTSDVTDTLIGVISIILGNDTTRKAADANTSTVLVDNAPPIVFEANVSSPVSGSNNSRTLFLNVSVVDVTAGVRAVVFNITNSTGVQNATYTGVRVGTLNTFNITINTSHFPDGTYNITIIANDTTIGGNANNTGRVHTIVFDNTLPIVFEANVSSPVSGSNNSRTLFLNVSVVDATAGVQTVFFNITNSTGVQNATYTGVRVGTLNTFNITINTSHFPDGTYNITIYTNDTAGNANNTGRVHTIFFDNTRPIIFNANVSSPPAGSNQSGTLLLNVSVVDATAGVQTVFFNITNSTGVQNASFTAVRVGTLNTFNISINTATFPSGIYNITVYTNDTAGNANNTAFVYPIRFDNTAPTATQTCTPNSVTEGEAIACTCSGTDTTTAVNKTVYTASPSTSGTGTHTTTCTVTDLAGNSGSVVTSFTVNARGSGTTSSSSGGGGDGGGASAGESLEEKTTRFVSISPETPSVMAFRNDADDFGVNEIVIAVTETASNVKVTAKTYGGTPSGVSAKDGIVFKYLEITTENLAAKLSEATIKAQVPKSWVETNLGGDTSDVAVFKFVDNQWTQLPTTYTGDSADGENHNYEARTTSFSFFVIGEKVVAPVVAPVVEEEEQPQLQPAETPAPAKASGLNTTWIIVGIIVVIIVVILIWWFVSRRQR